MKQHSLGTKLLLGAVTLAILAYFVLQGVRYFDDPLTTTLVYNYQVEEELSLSGYVVRDEQVLSNESSGLLQLLRAEGEKVSTGGVIATVYADQASLDRQTEMESVKTQLEQLEYAAEAALGTEASIKLDAQIRQCILDLRTNLTADLLAKAEGYGTDLRTLILKRDYTYSDTEDLEGQIASLEAQLKTLRAQTASSVRRVTAPVSGLYSAVVDGYETVLTPDMLTTLKPSTLSALEPDANTASNVGKLILGDSWYYVAPVTVDQAAALEEQGTVTLRFAKNVEQDLKVSLTDVGPEENGRVVAIFEGKTYLPQLTLLREQSAEVIENTISGIRVPKEALRAEKTSVDKEGNRTVTEVTGVYCVVGMEARFKPVNVLYNGDGFVLVESSATEEESRLRVGDEVIITANDLYDRKVVG